VHTYGLEGGKERGRDAHSIASVLHQRSLLARVSIRRESSSTRELGIERPSRWKEHEIFILGRL
jgi:hypothetical protein